MLDRYAIHFQVLSVVIIHVLPNGIDNPSYKAFSNVRSKQKILALFLDWFICQADHHNWLLLY